MRTVPSAVNPPRVPLATTDQTIERANGSTRMVKRAVISGVRRHDPPAIIQDPSASRGHVLDQEA